MISSGANIAGGVSTDSLDLQNGPLQNLLDPVNPQDAATKSYVDNAVTPPTYNPNALLQASTTGAVEASSTLSVSSTGTLVASEGIETGTLQATSLQSTSVQVPSLTSQAVVIASSTGILESSNELITNLVDLTSVHRQKDPRQSPAHQPLLL